MHKSLQCKGLTYGKNGWKAEIFNFLNLSTKNRRKRAIISNLEQKISWKSAEFEKRSEDGIGFVNKLFHK